MSRNDEQKRLIPFKAKANRYVEDKKSSLKLLNQAIHKATVNQKALGETMGKLQLFFSILMDWLSGEYTEIPKRSLVMLLLGLVYFVSPIDGILDYIPFAGLVDDAAVVGFVLSQVSVDLERYRQWKQAGEETKTVKDPESSADLSRG